MHRAVLLPTGAQAPLPWQLWSRMHLCLKDAGNHLLLATHHTSLGWALGQSNPNSPLSKDLPSQPTACW